MKENLVTNVTVNKANATKPMALWLKILIGMVLGVITGVILGDSTEMIKPIGTLFINIIRMLIVPLVFCSLIVGITSMKDASKMSRVGIKSIVIYLLTTAVAISIGLALATMFQPGVSLNLSAALVNEAKPTTNIVDTLLGMFPTNPIAALATGNILQIIVFAIFLGISLIHIDESKARPVIAAFEGFAEAMYKMTEFVMKFAPYGVYALMAWVAGQYGLDVLLPLVNVIILVYIGCIIHILFIGGGLVGLIGKLNPKCFYKGIFTAQVMAFSTTSTSGTLPVSMKCASENLGVSKSISSFILPMGATINMDGTALYQGVLVLFIAQAYGIDLSLLDYSTIILTATLASIGTAGIPGAGLIMLSLVLASVGLPLEGIAIVAGIDRILDMARTTVNVTGDLMVSVLIGKSERELDVDIYNQ
jgi:Na+/H+-dicarboxylate symporter